MKPREIRPQVYWVGAIDWDRRLFDELIPLPDYVVCNHAEQDHSGTLPKILEKYSRAKVICTPRCKVFLMDLLPVPEEKFVTVEDKQTVSLGDKTLEFIHAPWVHWPETMLTYLREERILFPCDLFGSHLATSNLYVADEGQVYESAKRYYAEIMMPFRANIERHLERLKDYPIDLIAPSHGPMYDRPDFILHAYRSWVLDDPQPVVVLAYASMHGSTREMVGYFVEALAQKGVAVKQFDLSEVDIGKLAMALVDAATLVLGTPTVMVGPHPKVAYAALLANTLRPKVKFACIIGSYGWGSQAKEQIINMIPNLKVELLEPVISKGVPKEADFKALDNLAGTIVQKHEELVKASS
jgi:flavorubredoxin